MHIPTRFIKRHAYQSHFSGLYGFKGYSQLHTYIQTEMIKEYVRTKIISEVELYYFECFNKPKTS